VGSENTLVLFLEIDGLIDLQVHRKKLVFCIIFILPSFSFSLLSFSFGSYLTLVAPAIVAKRFGFFFLSTLELFCLLPSVFFFLSFFPSVR